MTVDNWLGIAGLVVGVLGFVAAVFSITSDRLRELYLRWGIRKLPPLFATLAEEYRKANQIPENSTTSVPRSPLDDRMKAQNLVAARLGGFALGHGTARSVLVTVADDGYVPALAEVIAMEPRASDIPLIVEVTKRRLPTHANLRLLEAMKALALALSKSKLIQPSDRPALRAALDRIGEQLGTDHRKAVDEAWQIVDPGNAPRRKRWYSR